MNMNGPEANTIFTYIGASAIPCGYMIERTIDIALLKARGMRPHQDNWFTRFFGNGATLFVLTLTASLFGLLPTVLRFGAGDLINFLTSARQQMGFFGWPLSFAVVLYVVAPFIVGASVLISRLRSDPTGLPYGIRYADRRYIEQ